MCLDRSLSCNDVSTIKRENVSERENVEREIIVSEGESVSEDRTYRKRECKY